MIHLWSFSDNDVEGADAVIEHLKNKILYPDCLEQTLFSTEVFRIKTQKGEHHVLSVFDESRTEPICKQCLSDFRIRYPRPPLVIGISEETTH